MKAGAGSLFARPVPEHALLNTLRETLELSQGCFWPRSPYENIGDRYALLTPREREVIALAVAGRLNKQVGGVVGISEGPSRSSDAENENGLTRRSGENGHATLPDIIALECLVSFVVPNECVTIP